MDYYYNQNNYYYHPSESDLQTYQIDLPSYSLPRDFVDLSPPYHLPRDFDPSYYYPPYQSLPYNDHFPPQFTSSYYASGFGDFSESILVDPGIDSTRFVVSYLTTSDFNEPIFEEYDPVPYAGGYDPSATYGAPLPPSDKICYPRSNKGGIAPVPQVPTREADTATKDNPGGQEPVKAEPIPVFQPSLPPPGGAGTIGDGNLKERESASETEESGYGSMGGDSGNQGSLESIPYQPSLVIPGCGLDAVDICDGIFGYWPCLEREARRRRNIEMCNHHHHHHPHHHQHGSWPRSRSTSIQDWQIRTADFLFGSSNPYDNEDGRTPYGVPTSFQDQVHVNASVYSGNWF
ncbi:hypothetical protein MLD38_036952 [Melastoma candidum]|uniref:Uncharacterized protein n=1 Tax=Melastoma candidum TaxID=119954 RepID=A0ACB9LKS7_9MYRT|nr:hypothetical protein MLD38_036952 [Melastoma candidum]